MIDTCACAISISWDSYIHLLDTIALFTCMWNLVVLEDWCKSSTDFISLCAYSRPMFFSLHNCFYVGLFILKIIR